jgi:serine protease AprX
VPGSFIDQTYGALGAVSGGYMRGSGTSQATAVVSGAAALILQKHPTWTNNQVKALLTSTAKPLTAGTLTPAAQGRGTWNGRMWSGSSFTGSNWTATTWSGRMWSGRMWSSEVWSGRMWSGRMWSAGTWTGRMWSGDSWSGNTWSSAGWN